jgi:hemolysin activation/secretion protein
LELDARRQQQQQQQQQEEAERVRQEQQEATAAAAVLAAQLQEQEATRGQKEEQGAAPLEKLRVNLTTGRGGDPAELPLAYLAACTRDWSQDRLLGKGIFGQVFRGVDDARGVRFVVKRIDLTSLAKVSEDPSRLGRRMWEREVITQMCKHKFEKTYFLKNSFDFL